MVATLEGTLGVAGLSSSGTSVISALAPVTAFIVSALTIRVLLSWGGTLLVLDVPNERSLHSIPTPRLGGVGVLLGMAVGLLCMALVMGRLDALIWLFFGTAMVATVSLVDDYLDLQPIIRFGVHFLASLPVVVGGLIVDVPVLDAWVWALSDATAIGSAILFLVWMTNLYNFMDGMDGFAGGMAVIGFGMFAFLGWLSGDFLFSSLSATIAAAALGFLLFNYPPARIFMGDVGSSTLGFLAGSLTILADRRDVFPLWLGALIFSPFIVDATVTLIRRLLRGEKVWQAHKTHYYQRLVQLGWGHRKTVLWEYALMAACAGSAIWAVRQTEAVQWGVIGFWVIAYAALIAMVHRLEMKNSQLRMGYRD